jgi:hypothetical protein
MYKVRIKSSPSNKSTGDQDQYGLVRNLAVMQSSPEQVSVNDTMGAIPRSEANIEVEGGESVIGDVNKDGLMELMHFTGKRHSEGGMPVNIPEGSFIYSDTKKLTIKDPEVIEKIFNLSFRKQGYTPAEISKKYDINTFVQILKDENADAVSKRSAAEMLKKNKQKLGILAFIQESMKGFPDGIPEIAEEVLSTMGIDPSALMQEAAPQQPQQQQGIPASEDEAAMQGMMPAPPMSSPDDMAMQMGAGMFGGTALPRFEMAGVTGCPPGKRMYMGQCVEEWRIPAQEKFQYTSVPSAPTQRKPQTATQKEQQDLFDKSFDVTRRSPQEIAAEKTAAAIEQQRQNSGYYDKAKELEPFMGKVMNDDYTIGELLRVKELNQALMGITSDGTYTEDRKAEEKAMYDIDKQYGTLSQEQIAKKKREDDAQQTQKMFDDAMIDLDFYKTDGKKSTPAKAASISIPGFGSKSDLDSYMADTPEQYIAGEIYYKALQSKDPQEMLRAAQELKKIDVPWSVAWMPFTDQDKIDDMYTILHEEALKGINSKQKDIILTQYTKPIVTKKVDDLIAHYQKKLDGAIDVETKLNLARTLQKYKQYKNILKGKSRDGSADNAIYDSWLGSVKNSYVKPNSSFFDYDLGSPIQDSRSYVSVANSDQTIMQMLEEITSKHDAIKGTNFSKEYPLAFKNQTPSGGSGRGDTVSFSNESESFEVMNTENRIQDVANKLYASQTGSIKSSKNYKPEYTLQGKPGVVYYVGSDADGKATWFEQDEMGAVYAVSDKAVVQTLNTKASASENKPFAIKPAAPMNGVTADDVIIEQQIQQRTNPQVQKKVNPVAPTQAPKYDNGLTDENFNFAAGGSVNGGVMVRDGQPYRHLGNIDEFGRARYAKGGLVQFEGGGTPGSSSPPEEVFVKDDTVNGKAVKMYTQTFSDGTVIKIIRDAGTNTILGRKNELTGESIKDPNQLITRGSTEYVTKDNMNEYEKQQLAAKWNNDENQYLTFVNSRNQMLTNDDFKKDLYAQYQKDIESPEAYTGSTAAKKTTMKGSYYGDLKGLTQDQMLAELLAQEERNARLSAFGLKAEEGTQNVEKTYGSNTNQEAYDLRKAQQAGLGDLDWDKGYRGQAAYVAYRRLLGTDPKYKNQNYAEFQQGKDDETIFGIKGKVSGIDNYNTNTTLGQRLGWKAAPPAKPGEKTTWYCVEYSDGTKQIESVNYKEGETPVAPSGGKITTATQYEDSAQATANCKVEKKPAGKEEIPVEPQPLQPQPWFAPDIVNFGTGLRQRTPYTPPTLREMQTPASGYDTFNPITQIAGITGASKQYNDLLMNTMDPTVAAATGANFGFDALAKGISDIEGSNLGVTNANYDKVAQRNMQVNQFNTQARRQFDVDSAIATEERARDLNAKDAQNAGLWGRGWTNDMMDNGLRVEYPNAYHANRITGDFAWSGTGKDPLAFDTSGTGTGAVANGASAAAQDCLAVYSQAFSSAKAAGQDDAAAKDYAGKMQSACIQQNTASTNTRGRTQQGGYNQGAGNMFGAGYSNPMMRSREFGGSFFEDDNY